MRAWAAMKGEGLPRAERLLGIAKLGGFYVPSLYAVRHNEDGTVAAITPKHDGIAFPIQRCQTPDFEDAPFPSRPLVPFVQAVHERIAIACQESMEAHRVSTDTICNDYNDCADSNAQPRPAS